MDTFWSVVNWTDVPSVVIHKVLPKNKYINILKYRGTKKTIVGWVALKNYLKTKITSRMLMTPKQVANSAGAVYILTWSWMSFTLKPVSPIKDNTACRAEKWIYRTPSAAHTAIMRCILNVFVILLLHTWAKYKAESLAGTHVCHRAGSLLQGSCLCHVGPHDCYITYRGGMIINCLFNIITCLFGCIYLLYVIIAHLLESHFLHG